MEFLCCPCWWCGSAATRPSPIGQYPNGHNFLLLLIMEEASVGFNALLYKWLFVCSSSCLRRNKTTEEPLAYARCVFQPVSCPRFNPRFGFGRTVPSKAAAHWRSGIPFIALIGVNKVFVDAILLVARGETAILSSSS